MGRSAIPPFRRVALAVAILALAGCGAQGGTPSPSPAAASPSAPAATEPPASPSAEPSSPSASSSAVPASPPAGVPDLTTAVAVEDVATGFRQPVSVSPWGDGSGRLLVAEQGGTIRVVQGGQHREPPFLDITDRVSAGGERGLLGLAIPPGFGAGNPWLYVHYSGTDGGQTVVSAFRLAGDGASLDPGSERVVFTTPQPYANHNGGYLGFDTGGMLLLALGDGGSGGDPENRASDLREPLGKILRFDVSGVPDGEPYAIPADNPYADDPDALPEILHSGLRNPFRANVDPATGDLWIGDVGQGAWEEIDVARAGQAGLDFGWRRWEGRHCYNPPTDCDPGGVTMPVTEYGHGLGCSVIGGVVYHGAAMPTLDGAYLFADYCSGTLWGIVAASDEAQEPATLLETGTPVSSIMLDEDGEVLLTLHADGRVVRLVPAP